jgi:hypothetical protein
MAGRKEEEVCKKIAYSPFELQVVRGGKSHCGAEATTGELEHMIFDDFHHHHLTHNFLALTCEPSPTSLLLHRINSYRKVKF